MNFPALLAEVAPIDAKFQLNVWSLVTWALAIAALIAAFRRKPPLESELATLNSSIKTLGDTVTELKTANAELGETLKEHGKHGTELAAQAKVIESLQKDVAALQGHREEDNATQRRHMAHTVKEFTEAMDRLRTAVSNNTIQVERALGGVTGELKQLTSRVEGIERDMRN